MNNTTDVKIPVQPTDSVWDCAGDPRYRPDSCYFVGMLTARAAQMATDEELAEIRRWIEATARRLYREGYADRMLGLPDGPGDWGHVTVLLDTTSPGVWRYRRATWDQGPFMVGDPGSPLRDVLGLVCHREWDGYKLGSAQ